MRFHRRTGKAERAVLAHAGMVLLCAAVLLPAAQGCQRRSTPESSRTPVQGTVSFDGAPLPGGSITLVSVDDPNLRVTAMIREDGRFAVADAPRGEVRIAVETEMLRFGAPEELYVRIPPHYANPETSNLTGTVAPGEPAIQVELHP